MENWSSKFHSFHSIGTSSRANQAKLRHFLELMFHLFCELQAWRYVPLRRKERNSWKIAPFSKLWTIGRLILKCLFLNNSRTFKFSLILIGKKLSPSERERCNDFCASYETLCKGYRFVRKEGEYEVVLYL